MIKIKSFCGLLVVFLFLFGPSISRAEKGFIIGPLSVVEPGKVIIANRIYPLQPVLKGVNMSKALGNKVSSAAFDVEVRNTDNKPLSYETFKAIGHASNAKAIIKNGYVSEIHILLMEQ